MLIARPDPGGDTGLHQEDLTFLLTRPPKTGPESMLVLDRSGGSNEQESAQVKRFVYSYFEFH
jgi:hypothetical protein